MSESEHEHMNKPREGLTKPLVNNIGGVIDQDAPSADQLAEKRSGASWDNTALRKGEKDVQNVDRSGLIDTALDKDASRPGRR